MSTFRPDSREKSQCRLSGRDQRLKDQLLRQQSTSKTQDAKKLQSSASSPMPPPTTAASHRTKRISTKMVGTSNNQNIEKKETRNAIHVAHINNILQKIKKVAKQNIVKNKKHTQSISASTRHSANSLWMAKGIDRDNIRQQDWQTMRFISPRYSTSATQKIINQPTTINNTVHIQQAMYKMRTGAEHEMRYVTCFYCGSPILSTLSSYMILGNNMTVDEKCYDELYNNK